MPDEQGSRKNTCFNHQAAGGTVYAMGLIGAAVYYFQHAPSFGAGALGLLKAIVWPAILVYQLFSYLHL